MSSDRWFESEDAPEEIRALLRAAREEGPPPEVVSRLGSRLGVTRGGAFKTLAPKGLVALGALGLIAGAIAGFKHEDAPRSAVETRAAPAAYPAEEPVRSVVERASGADSSRANLPSSDEPEASTSAGPSAAGPGSAGPGSAGPGSAGPGSSQGGSRKLPRAATDASSAPNPADVPGGPAEIALIRQAHASVGRDPALALRLVDQHRARFPEGKLTQEREVIAVQALKKLGRASDAEARAATFAERHPDSAHKVRVERETQTPR